MLQAAKESYDAKVELSGRESFAGFERSVLLYSLDSHWREHLAALDHLRQGIHLRGYAQKNPKQEYKREAFELFAGMLEHIKLEVTRTLMQVQVSTASEAEAATEQEISADSVDNVQYHHSGYDEALATSSNENPEQFSRVGRNDPCPCGSGKKYKQCHGALS